MPMPPMPTKWIWYFFKYIISGYGLRVSGCALRVPGCAFRVTGCAFRVTGCAFRDTWERLSSRDVSILPTTMIVAKSHSHLTMITELKNSLIEYSTASIL
jgi:hypothetical protein